MKIFYFSLNKQHVGSLIAHSQRILGNQLSKTMEEVILTQHLEV
jgi:hypothetical protein